MQIFQKTIDPFSAMVGFFEIIGGSKREVDQTVAVGDSSDVVAVLTVGVMPGVGVTVDKTAAPAGWAGVKAIMPTTMSRKMPDVMRVSARLLGCIEA
jgi:hypothetical protein